MGGFWEMSYLSSLRLGLELSSAAFLCCLLEIVKSAI